MAIKLFGNSITSAYKSIVSTVSKNVSKVKGGSSSKSSSTKSKSSSVSKVSSTTKQSTTTKYVTNAAAIYNASGKKVSVPSSVSTGRPAQSYATQTKTSTTNSKKSTGSATTAKTTTAKTKTVSSSSAKSTSNKVPSSISTGRPAQSYATQAKTSTTNNQKTVKTASDNKTVIGPQNRTTNSAISTGRPKESYISQQKASTAKGQATAQTKLPVPVAKKAPTSKKDPSEASYSNNRPKQSYTHVVTYKPSPSREGAGQMVYTTKTDPKGAKAGASFATSCIPYVGDAKDIQEAVTGKDLITGKKLTGGERAITITAAVLPVVSSPMLKGAAKGGKVAVKEAPNAVKKAGTFIKKNAPEVKKTVKNNDAIKNAKIIPPKQVNGGTYNVEVPPAKFIGDKPVTGSHNATIKVIDKKGEITNVWREVSGNATESEKALGIGRMRQATHTEQRALTRLHLTDETVLITGQQAPCRNCQGAMRKATMSNSATVIYQWREKGKTSQAIWKNGKKVKE